MSEIDVLIGHLTRILCEAYCDTASELKGVPERGAESSVVLVVHSLQQTRSIDLIICTVTSGNLVGAGAVIR